MSVSRRILGWLSRVGDTIFRDGLDTVGYLVRIEDEFGIQIPDKEAVNIKTLAELCNYVAKQRQLNMNALGASEIWTTVRDITSEEFGVDAGELHPEIRFVEDLGC
ncbi:MAG: hypothetical protein H7144_04240 [Burkholderiales bacterium]|nr:hypothetical protein [Phycisphaerae bacterium]